MKSRISFFNAAISKKDLTRFWPIWALYTVLLLICMLPTVSGGSHWSHPVENLSESIALFAIFNLFYAILNAQLLFGELYNSRLCNALHAMPVTRTARFFSHLATGLAFSLVPNLLTAGLMMPSLGRFWFAALFWAAGVSLQYLFFFAVAIFAVMCTGSRFAGVLFYGILNFILYIFYWFISVVFLPMMPGVVVDLEGLLIFCPAFNMINERKYMLVHWEGSPTYQYDGLPLEYSSFGGPGESWNYLLVLAAIGLGVIALSWLLYRRRKLESAGDFIAVGWIRPVFLVLYTLCGGAFLSSFGSLFADDLQTFFILLGLVIGFFTGKMLVERTIRVFKKKNFLQAVIFATVLGLMLGAVKLDLLGIVRYVPEVDDISYITVQRSYANERDLNTQSYKELVTQIHTHALEDYCDRTCGKEHTRIYLEYHLNDGRTVIRQYYLCKGTTAANLIYQLPGDHLKG